MISLWWLRRDIRLADNLALHFALMRGGVVPVFVLDPHLLAKTPANRQAFLLDGLRVLASQLAEKGSQLVVRSGPPEQVLAGLLAETGAEAVFAEEDFSPYARVRDARVAARLPLHLIHGATVLHPLLVHKPNGLPYTVFTPFSKTWKALLPPDIAPLSAPQFFPEVPKLPSEELPGLHQENLLFPSGEAEAQRRLAGFISDGIQRYEENRNRMDLDGTSALSPYLRFGMLSMRQAAHAAILTARSAGDPREAHAAEIWLNELIWREFYTSILYYFPRVSRNAFNLALGRIPWRQAQGDFEAWKAGETGVPVVDAAMRQLSATGWMHNRARMITASYLVKDLLIDWRRGERWFMQNLLDGDPASNNGGWQWTAGTGTDAAPYFRIFNPLLQSRKFDPEGAYIRKWLPALAHLSAKVIHAPWEHGISVPGYPAQPLVEHALVKERTLKAYSLSKGLPKYSE